MSKKLLFVVIASLMVLAFALPAQASAPAVVLDGKAMTFDVPPVIENDRTLVPMRAIFEAQGATVAWDDATQTVTATKGATTIKLVIGGKAFVNGKEVALDVPAKLVSDRTMVPLRFVSENLGADVKWDDASQTVTITSKAATPATPATPVAPATPATPATPAAPAAPTEPAKPVAVTSFEKYLDSLPYDATVLKGVNKTAQFNITGEDAGQYIVQFNDGKVIWSKGKTDKPDVTVTSSEKEWLAVSSRTVDPIGELLNGNYAVDGDIDTFKELKDAYIKKAQ